MDDETIENLAAEIAALKMAAMVVLNTLASESGDRNDFLDRLLDVGARNLDHIDYAGVSAERKDDFSEGARRRFRSMVEALRTST